MTEENNTKKPHKTSSTIDFFAKYKDPRWQKKRLEVMQQADFRCESCESGEKTLNVHHKSYKKNHNPWEYDEWELECLCEDCHNEKHKIKDRLTAALHNFKTDVNFDYTEDELLGFLDAKMADGPFGDIPISYEYLRGYCAANLLDVDEVNANGKLDEIIEAENGRLICNTFEWAFKSKSHLFSSKWHLEHMRKEIAVSNGEYSHYPNWLIEKILKQVAQVLDDDTINP
jgi:Zn finger protein HypA/HybF involved in hydrogenase expression